MKGLLFAVGVPEANPLMPASCAGIVAVSGAETIATAFLAARLEKSHPTLARGLMITTIGTTGVIVGWNLRAFTERRR
jgi:hypothetical protein